MRTRATRMVGRGRKLLTMSAFVASLFARGEQGLWYDPADLSDAKLNWRKNQLLFSEQFSSGNWTKVNVSVLENVAAAPGGAMTADKIVENTNNGSHSVTQSTASAGIPTVLGQAYVGMARIKKAERGFAFVGFNGGGILYFVSIDLTTGASFVAATQAGVTYKVVALADGWFEVYVYATATSSASMPLDIRTSIDGVWGNRSYTGDGTSGILLAAASVTAGTTDEYQMTTDGASQDFMRLFPYHTMFQDTQGVNPVTSFEQPIGLILDKRFGGMRGPELLSAADAGGPFLDTGAGWVSTGGNTVLTYGGGELRATFVSTASSWVIRRPNIPLVANMSYEFLIELRTSAPIQGTGFNINFYNETAGTGMSGVGSALTNSVNNTVLRVIFTPTQTGNYSFILARTTASADDNGKVVSVLRASAKGVMGNHAFQPTTTSRTSLSARVNKCQNFNANPVDLTGTSKAGDAAAVLTVEDDSAAIALAPLEMRQLCTSKRVYKLDNTLGVATATCNIVGQAGIQIPHTLSVYVRNNGNSDLRTSAGAVANNFGPSNPQYVRRSGTVTPDTTTRALTIAAAPGSVVYFALNQMEEGGVASRPQVVNGSSYDGTAWPRYFNPDGVDDTWAVSNIDFSGTDKVAVLSGLKKLTDAQTAMVAELSGITETTNGAFALLAPSQGGAGRFDFRARGTGAVLLVTADPIYNSPVSAVVAGQADIAASSLKLWVNGAVVATSSASMGTGNFGAFPMNFFRRSSGGALPFSGKCYGILIRGGLSNDGQMITAQRFLAKQMQLGV